MLLVLFIWILGALWRNKMKSDYADRVAISSTLLGKLLSNLEQDSLGNVNNILQDKNVKRFLCDEELIHTAEVFFANNLNLIKTSKELIVHRNTLVYRLEKIKKSLGLDIRTFEDAVTLQVLLVLKRTEIKRKRQANKVARLQKLK